MENLEQTIQAVLNDPEQMKQVMQMAKAFGFSPSEGEKQEPENDAQAEIPAGMGNLFSEPIGQLLSQAGKTDPRRENLLNAIKPFLSPDKQEKIDRAMQVARLSHLAGYALRSREQKDE